MEDKISNAIKLARKMHIEKISRSFLEVQGYSWGEFPSADKDKIKKHLTFALKDYHVDPYS